MVCGSNETEIGQLRERVDQLEQRVEYLLTGTKIMGQTICTLIAMMDRKGLVDCPLPQEPPPCPPK